MSARSDKPHATSENIKVILSRPVRPLTEAERKERVAFYEETGHNAVPVEPGAFSRNRTDGERWR